MRTCTPVGCGEATAISPSRREQFASGRFVLAAVGSGGTPEPGSWPAVARTAFPSKEDRESTHQAGFQAHLGERVDDELLVSVLRRYAKHGLRRAR